MKDDEIQKFQGIAEEKDRQLQELEDRTKDSAQQYQLQVHQWCNAYAQLLKRHQELETVSERADIERWSRDVEGVAWIDG